MAQTKLDNYLLQSENKLITKQKCTLFINLNEYTKDDLEIDEEEEILRLKSLISRMEYEDKVFSLILDYAVNIDIADMMDNIDVKKMLVLEFNENDQILEVPLEADILTEQVRYVKRLLGGKEIYQGVDHLFLKLFKVYSPLSSTDLVHLEVMLSQCLRDKEKQEIPARLSKKWNPTMINIKQIVFSKSFIEGLAFENINESIKTGLISEESLDESILEKLLTGNLVPEPKKIG